MGGVIIILCILYLIPTVIAISRGHVSIGGIIALNILLGWTVAGWIGALIWSLSSSGKQTIVVKHLSTRNHQEVQQHSNPSQTTATGKNENYDQKLERLQKLKQMLDNGVLSEEEFAKEKAKILEN